MYWTPAGAIYDMVVGRRMPAMLHKVRSSKVDGDRILTNCFNVDYIRLWLTDLQGIKCQTIIIIMTLSSQRRHIPKLS